MLKFPFIPREHKFFDLFEQSARNMVEASHVLNELVDTWEDVEDKVARIAQMEDEGDAVTHQIMAQLNRTFVTPFDREDIALLAHSLDDVTDFIDAAADAMLIYKVKRPTPRAEPATAPQHDPPASWRCRSYWVRAPPHDRKRSPGCRGTLTISGDVYQSCLGEKHRGEPQNGGVNLAKWREQARTPSSFRRAASER